MSAFEEVLVYSAVKNIYMWVLFADFNTLKILTGIMAKAANYAANCYMLFIKCF